MWRFESSEKVDEDFIRSCLDELEIYSKIKYLSMSFPLKASFKLKSDL